VDLGANDGKFAAELLAHYPEASLVLVEGDPFLVERLRERFAGRGAVRIFAGLVGGESRREAPFHLSRIPEGNSVHAALAASWTRDETRTIEVPMVTLGTLLALARLGRVDLLKVDIEGRSTPCCRPSTGNWRHGSPSSPSSSTTSPSPLGAR
jgi:FkbM family methyltransferase